MYLGRAGLEDFARTPIFNKVKYFDGWAEFLSQEAFYEKRYVVFTDNYLNMGILDMKTLETKEIKIDEIMPEFRASKKPYRLKTMFIMRNEQVLIYHSRMIEVFDIKTNKITEKFEIKGHSGLANPLLISKHLISFEAEPDSIVFFKISEEGPFTLTKISHLEIKKDFISIESITENKFCVVLE